MGLLRLNFSLPFLLSKFEYSCDPLLVFLVSGELVRNIVWQILYVGRVKWLFGQVRLRIQLFNYLLIDVSCLLFFSIDYLVWNISDLGIIIETRLGDNFLYLPSMSFFLFLMLRRLSTWSYIDQALIISTLKLLLILFPCAIRSLNFLLHSTLAYPRRNFDLFRFLTCRLFLYLMLSATDVMSRQTSIFAQKVRKSMAISLGNRPEVMANSEVVECVPQQDVESIASRARWLLIWRVIWYLAQIRSLFWRALLLSRIIIWIVLTVLRV